MDLSRYGPFALVVAIAAALIATFSLMLVKAAGRVSQWTWLVENTPSFMVTVAVRAVAVALIGLTFFTIDAANYRWFGYGAAGFGVLTAVLIFWFDAERRLHVWQVPVVGADGQQAQDTQGRPTVRPIIIGRERDMRPEARAALEKARKTHGGLSLMDFLAGYGAKAVYNPAAAWPEELLAAISNRLTMLLVGILLCAVMALYEAASAVEASLRFHG